MSWETILSVLRERGTEWLDAFIELLPNLFVAIVVFAFFVALARVAKAAIGRLLDRFLASTEVAVLLSNLAYLAVIGGGVFLTLEILHLEKTVTSLLAGVGIVGLALGFAFQDLAANFMSGILIAFRRPYELGHVVETQGELGTVRRMSIRATHIQTFDGKMVRIPNRKIIEGVITNYTASGERRVDVDVGVAYGEDLERAKETAVEAVSAMDLRDRDRDVECYYQGFGASSIDFSLRFWIDYPDMNILEARSQAVQRIQRAFADADITIPFPIRTLDFGTAPGGNGFAVVPRDEEAETPEAANGGTS